MFTLRRRFVKRPPSEATELVWQPWPRLVHGGYRAQGTASDGSIAGFKGDLLWPRLEQMYIYIYIYIFVYIFLYLYTYILIYLYIYIFTYLYIYIFIYLHIYIFIYLYIFYIYIFIYLYIYIFFIFIYLYIYIFIYLYIYIFIYLYIYIFIYLYVYMFICLYILCCVFDRPSAKRANWPVRPGYRDAGPGKLCLLVASRPRSFCQVHVPNRSIVSGMHAGMSPKPTRSRASTSCSNTCRPSRRLVTGSFVRILRGIGCKPAGSIPGAWL